VIVIPLYKEAVTAIASLAEIVPSLPNEKVYKLVPS